MIKTKDYEFTSFEKALELINYVEPADRSLAYKMVSIRQAMSGKFSDALNTTKKIFDEDDIFYALKEIAEAQVKINLIEDAISTAEKFSSISDRDWIYYCIVEHLCDSDLFDEANLILKNIQDNQRKLLSILRIANYLADKEDFLQSNKYYLRALKIDKSENCGFKNAIYIKMIDNGLINSELEIKKKVNDNNSRAILLGNLAKTIAESGKINQSEEIFNSAIKIAKCSDNSVIIYKPVVVVIEQLLEAGFLTKARMLGNYAKSTFNEYFVFGKIAQAYADKGLIQEAKDSAKEIIDRRNYVEELSEIIAKQIEFDSLANVLKELESINDPIYKTKALLKIAIYIAKKGEINKSKNIFNKTLIESKKIIYESPRNRSIFDLVEAQFELGFIEDSIINVENFENLRHQCKTLGYIASQILQNGDINFANSIFSKAMSLTEFISNPFEMFEATLDISSFYASTDYREYPIIF